LYDILSQSRALFYLNFIIIAPSSLRHATKHIPPAQVTSTTGGRTETRTYNAFNQLTQVTAPDLAASYLYRADGLRRSKTVNGVVTTHVWDRGQIVLETGANTAVVINRFNRCLGGRLILSPQFGWYLYDARGSVVQRTVNQGGILHNYRYTAFGNAITAPNSVASTNPFRFNGMYWDAHRGEYMTPNRMFNPRLGRWTQPDPFFHMRFGQARMMGSSRAIAQSGNLFMFTMHNPVRWNDPTGLFAQTPTSVPLLERPGTVSTNTPTGGWLARPGTSMASASPIIDMDMSGVEAVRVATPVPTIISRGGWSAPEVTFSPFTQDVTRIVMHHTYRLPASLDNLPIAESVRWVDNLHAGWNWGGSGYHYLIGHDGSIFQGRPRNSQGRHARRGRTYDRDPFSIGIAFIGDFSVDSPTQAQLDSLFLLTDYILFRIPTINTIECHWNTYFGPWYRDVQDDLRRLLR